MARAKRYRIVVFASGRGSNFKALLDAAKAGVFDGDIVALVVDNRSAGAIDIARENDIKVHIESRDRHRSRVEFDLALAKIVNDLKADIVCLAGFMRILSKDFLEAVGAPVLNIHPSLLPAFPGLEAQRQAIEAGASESGCTAHFVDEGVDTGHVIVSARARIEPDDTVESLSAKILKLEHEIYPEALRRITSGEIDPRPHIFGGSAR